MDSVGFEPFYKVGPSIHKFNPYFYKFNYLFEIVGDYITISKVKI